MIIIHLADIWTAAGIILGFQFTAISWRISRELSMEEKGIRTWLPVSDFVNLASMFVLVNGVFVLPILGLIDENLMKYGFGLALLLFLGYPFALAGHYQLYPGKKNMELGRGRGYMTKQERNAVIIIGFLTFIYILIAVVNISGTKIK